MKKYTLLLPLLVVLCANGQSTKAVFPVKVSPNGRYLVDEQGQPFFYNAETPWLLFNNLLLEEAGELLDTRIRQGFNVMQVQLLPFAPIDRPNRYGTKPFEDNDFTKPNEAFFDHTKRVIRLAEGKGVLVVMNPVWLDCCRTGWEEIIRKNGPEKCRQYGRYLGNKFKEHPNLLWLQGGDKDPRELIDHYRQIALGIREAIPAALQTYHASSSHSSTDVIPYASNQWLNFSFTYTYFGGKRAWLTIAGIGRMPEVYEVNYRESVKKPVRPFVLGESQYEGERTIGDTLAGADIMRRQAYWSVLSGSCGAAYGSWNWAIPDDWRRIEKDPGAWDMGIFRQFFQSFAWYNLVPDPEGSLVKAGQGTFGEKDYATAAMTANRNKMIVYLPPTGTGKRELTVDVSRLKNPYRARWFNPANGAYRVIDTKPQPNKGVQRFSTPGDNGEGHNDWVLVLDSAE